MTALPSLALHISYLDSPENNFIDITLYMCCHATIFVLLCANF